MELEIKYLDFIFWKRFVVQGSKEVEQLLVRKLGSREDFKIGEIVVDMMISRVRKIDKVGDG